MIRKEKPIEQILQITNQRILIDQYYLTKKDVDLVNGIWRKLSSRRLNRK